MISLSLGLLACSPPPLELAFPDAPGDDTGVPPPGDTGSSPWTVPTDRPLRLLFVGNSFTAEGPIAALVRELAASVGWPAPDIAAVAPGGQDLLFHRTNPGTLARVNDGPWDAVVLQDHSLRPTDDAGDPEGFKADATWFYDRIKASSADADVVLYQTWARHPDHQVYPGTFPDPIEMQAQLRFHYDDAADRYIPENATATPSTDVRVSPVGDAWEIHLAETDPLVLHASDLHHASPSGRALAAMVIYSTIYGVAATGTGDLALPRVAADRLRASADAATGITLAPPALEAPSFGSGQVVEVDFGILDTDGFGSVTNCLTGGTSAIVDTNGQTTSVAVRVTRGFEGSNESGLAGNTLGWPDTVSRDVCFLGSFDGHDAALLERATVEVSNLEPGPYTLTLFASREGDDNGAGRLTRYTVGSSSRDLEASDNTGDVAVFEGVEPDTRGVITIDVTVSPAGTARFGYLGALTLARP